MLFRFHLTLESEWNEYVDSDRKLKKNKTTIPVKIIPKTVKMRLSLAETAKMLAETVNW